MPKTPTGLRSAFPAMAQFPRPPTDSCHSDPNATTRSVSPGVPRRARSTANSPSKHPRSPSLSRCDSLASLSPYGILPPHVALTSGEVSSFVWRKEADNLGSCNTSMASVSYGMTGYCSATTTGGSLSSRSQVMYPAVMDTSRRSASPGIAYTPEERAIYEECRSSHRAWLTEEDLASVSYRSDSPSRYSCASNGSFIGFFGRGEGSGSGTPLAWGRRTSLCSSVASGRPCPSADHLQMANGGMTYRPATPSAMESAATMLARVAARRRSGDEGFPDATSPLLPVPVPQLSEAAVEALLTQEQEDFDDELDGAKRFRVERARSVRRDDGDSSTNHRHPSSCNPPTDGNLMARALSAQSSWLPMASLRTPGADDAPSSPLASLSRRDDILSYDFASTAAGRDSSPAPPVYRQRTVSPSLPRGTSPVPNEASTSDAVPLWDPSLSAGGAPVPPLRNRSVRFCEPTLRGHGPPATTTDSSEKQQQQQHALSAGRQGSQSRRSEGRLSDLSVYSTADDEPQIDELKYVQQELQLRECADAEAIAAWERQQQRRRVLSCSQHALDVVNEGSNDVGCLTGARRRVTVPELSPVRLSSSMSGDRCASPPMRERSLAPAELREKRS